MFNLKTAITSASIIALLAITLTGCVISSVVSRSDDVATHKLSEIDVKWSDNKKLKYSIFKRASAITKEKAEEGAKITQTDKLQSMTLLNKLVHEFRTNAAETIQNNLTSQGIVKGDRVVMTLKPVKVGHAMGGGRNIRVQVTITHKTSSEIKPWSTIIRVNGQKSESDSRFLEEFTEAVHEELSDSGWI